MGDDEFTTEDLGTTLPESEAPASEGPFDSDLTQDATPPAPEFDSDPEPAEEKEPVRQADPGKSAAAAVDALRSRPLQK